MAASRSDALVLFGATGDLAHKMIFPALYALAKRGDLKVPVIGVAAPKWSLAQLHDRVKDSIERAGGIDNQAALDQLMSLLGYVGGDYNDQGTFTAIKKALGGAQHPAHYLAIPPSLFGTVIKGLGAAGLAEGARVIVEKPFGRDLASAIELNRVARSVFPEDSIFRIDHFLGKEATQNLHVLRFGNEMMNRVWCREAVAQVQIDVPETLDVADRAGFYDATGAFRDMIVTHLFQVAAEVAMEPPVSMSAEDLQVARESVMAAFRPLQEDDVVFGQYAGYADLPDVKDGSTTDTFAAARLWVDTDRWQGVPFLLRSGKQLGVSRQVVTLLMRPVEGPLTQVPAHSSMLQLSLSGSGAIEMQLIVKEPGAELTLVPTRTDLDLGSVAEGAALPPYVSLLHDVTIGDRSLFTSSAGLQSAWTAAAAVVDSTAPPIAYEPGSSGPQEAEHLTDGVGWLSEAVPG